MMSPSRLLLLTLLLCASLILAVPMFSLNHKDADEFHRYQRGFGNRRALIARLQQDYPKQIACVLNGDEEQCNDKYSLLNSPEAKQQTDFTERQRHLMMFD